MKKDRKGAYMLSTNIKRIIDITLGDGYLGYGKVSKHAHYSCGHSTNQRDYLLHKMSILLNLGYKTTEYVYEKSCSIYTANHQDFSTAHKWIYNKSRKFIDNALLRNCDAETLAYWFMDDGGADKTNKLRYKNKLQVYESPKTKSYSLYTNCFSYDENVLITLWLKEKFNITANIYINKGPYIRISDIPSKDSLRNTIEPYIISCMRYKIKTPHSFDNIAYSVVCNSRD